MRRKPMSGAVAVLCLCVASTAFAQLPLTENHYKVYMSTPIPIVRDVKLTDQFGSFNVTDLVFDRFATPAQKTHAGVVYPMVDPLRHHDWWRIHNMQPSRTVIGYDQFGQASWTLGDAVYLLVPSLKNVSAADTTGPALSNHYVCYDVLSGPMIGTAVLLADQFGNVQVQVLKAKYFCNPAQKEVDGGFGGIWFIEDPIVHLACYTVENPSTDIHSITARDQFGFWQTQLNQNDCLCVPALKNPPLPTRPSTWGRIKALYRG